MWTRHQWTSQSCVPNLLCLCFSLCQYTGCKKRHILGVIKLRSTYYANMEGPDLKGTLPFQHHRNWFPKESSVFKQHELFWVILNSSWFLLHERVWWWNIKRERKKWPGMQVLGHRFARSQGRKREGKETPERAFNKSKSHFHLIFSWREDYLREQKALLRIGTQKHVHLFEE